MEFDLLRLAEIQTVPRNFVVAVWSSASVWMFSLLGTLGLNQFAKPELNIKKPLRAGSVIVHGDQMSYGARGPVCLLCAGLPLLWSTEEDFQRGPLNSATTSVSLQVLGFSDKTDAC